MAEAFANQDVSQALWEVLCFSSVHVCGALWSLPFLYSLSVMVVKGMSAKAKWYRIFEHGGEYGIVTSFTSLKLDLSSGISPICSASMDKPLNA